MGSWRDVWFNITNFQGSENQNHHMLLSHPYRNDDRQKGKRWVLAGMWRKGDPLTLLVKYGLVQSLWEIHGGSSKLKNGTTTWWHKLTAEYASKGNENRTTKRCLHSLFTAALLTTANIRKQPKCPPVDKWITKIWSVYTLWYYSPMRRKQSLPFWHMDGPWGHYAK